MTRSKPPAGRTLREAAAASLAIDAATVEAFAVLEKAGIPALLLKGPAVAQLLYGRGEERSYDDADVLVPPDREAVALEALAGIGFAPRIGSELERGSVPHAVHLVRPSRAPGVNWESIDLHRTFAGVEVTPAEFWASVARDSDSISLFGTDVPVPSVPARLALTALHAGSHGGGHRRSLRDVERAVERFGRADWEAARDLGREWRAEDLFAVGIALTPAGSRLRAQLGITAEPRVSARMRGAGMPRAQRALEQLARERGARARLRLIARRVVPSPDLMRTWKPLARRGRAGLALAYLWRPFWLIGQLGPAALAYLRARRH